MFSLDHAQPWPGRRVAVRYAGHDAIAVQGHVTGEDHVFSPASPVVRVSVVDVAPLLACGLFRAA